MRLLSLALAITAASVAGGQSVNPPIAVFEGGSKHVKGSMVVDNPTIFPISFVVEPRRFLVACSGDMAFGSIDTTRMRVRLSSMSGRLAAKQRATIFYDVEVDSVPSWLALLVRMSPGRPDPGLSVRLEIPHMIYVMQKDRVRSADVSLDSAIFDSASRTLRIRVRNASTRLTRITELVALSAAGQERSIDACPLFPNDARDFVYPWPDAQPPAKVIARFAGFSHELAVTTAGKPPTAMEPRPCAPCGSY